VYLAEVSVQLAGTVGPEQRALLVQHSCRHYHHALPKNSCQALLPSACNWQLALAVAAAASYTAIHHRVPLLLAIYGQLIWLLCYTCAMFVLQGTS
jgi:hypothetical protein